MQECSVDCPRLREVGLGRKASEGGGEPLTPESMSLPTDFLAVEEKQVGPGGIWRPKGSTSGSTVLEQSKRGQETSREETGLQGGSISKTL